MLAVRGIGNRIAENVRAVEAGPAGVPARGCLVLIEPFHGKRGYEATHGTPVPCTMSRAWATLCSGRRETDR